ncbi:MAG: hypothetical protein ACRDY5_06735, partial [Acidimicrobiales bacterium]
MTLRRAIALVLVASGLLAACSSGRPASVDISSRAFGFSPDGSDSYESILLSGKFDNDAAVLALQRAATRFMLVTSDGTEHPSEESVERVVGTGLLYS